ncbi:P1 family peptidase [Oricola sp.]|uniref:P1 family peptidase n=1 Tax=Oricola sp. TaxID=1979950 RepID=UPI000C938641|nr:peptidase T4 [Ahrensia sp.]|tara:strand:- start:19302 stop:20312 length:1011 start_codon:yes stop_codon:yes gene_type:complete
MTAWTAGPRNLITDVAGLKVGHADDATVKSGVTAILCEEPAVASVQVLGGAPGTRETDLLDPHNTVDRVDAFVLSGGSAFGLDAASGVQAVLLEAGRGYPAGPYRVPIVPAAILFDLANGGDKEWGRYPPYRELGYAALNAATRNFPIGSHGAGTGATTADLKGGLGSASTVLRDHDITVGALAAVNSLGTTTITNTRHFWAAPFEIGDEFGGLGMPSPFPADASRLRIKYRDDPRTNTTIAVIATDAKLDKAECKRLATAAHDGFARAIWPSHTPMDGDLVFAVSTGRKPLDRERGAMIDLCAAAASTMARAIARGVFAATPKDGDKFPCWSQRA